AGQTFLSLPRSAVVRLHINHLIHHRGQLTVYLRLLDVPLPPIYGPTADEQAMM
ncbi:MAG: DinB family protein, partial [Gemmatimonadales bacterium]